MKFMENVNGIPTRKMELFVTLSRVTSRKEEEREKKEEEKSADRIRYFKILNKSFNVNIILYN